MFRPLIKLLLGELLLRTVPFAKRRFQQRWNAYIDKITTSGYVQPMRPRILATARFIARVLIYLKFGKLTVIGEENYHPDDHVILCWNHQSLWDTLVYLASTKQAYYGLAADNVMRNFHGIPAAIMVQGGAIPVNRDDGKTALDPAIDVFVTHKRFGLAPEGKINPDKMGIFKPGAAIIVQRCYEKLIAMVKAGKLKVDKVRVGIQPGHINYHRRTKAATKRFLGLLPRRPGITLTLLQTVYYDPNKHQDPHELMGLIHSKIAALEPNSN